MNERIENNNSLSEEQLERQSRFEDFKENLGVILQNMNSNITSEFTDYMKSKNLNLKDYFLAHVFIAMVKGEKIPNEKTFKNYDTEKDEIYKYVMALSLPASSK